MLLLNASQGAVGIVSHIAGLCSTWCPPESLASSLQRFPQSFGPQLVPVCDIIPIHVEDPAFPLINFMRFQLAWSVRHSSQFCIICKIHTITHIVTKMLNNIGHSVRPWGAPPVAGFQPYSVLLITILWAWQLSLFLIYFIACLYSLCFHSLTKNCQ